MLYDLYVRRKQDLEAMCARRDQLRLDLVTALEDFNTKCPAGSDGPRLRCLRLSDRQLLLLCDDRVMATVRLHANGTYGLQLDGSVWLSRCGTHIRYTGLAGVMEALAEWIAAEQLGLYKDSVKEKHNHE